MNAPVLSNKVVRMTFVTKIVKSKPIPGLKRWEQMSGRGESLLLDEVPPRVNPPRIEWGKFAKFDPQGNSQRLC